MAIQKEDAHPITVKFPKTLLEEIDQMCAAEYISRTSWLVRSARYFLDEHRKNNTEKVLARIATKTNNLI